MLTNLIFKFPNGTPVVYTEFEVHKDPIRTNTSDGVQYRLKIRGIQHIPEELVSNGILELYDITSSNFWIKKCFVCELTFDYGKVIHNLYLLPMSYQSFTDGSFQFICIEVSEKLIELEKNSTMVNIGLDDFSTYFKKRFAEANSWLDDTFDRSRNLKSISPAEPKRIKILCEVPASEIDRSNNTIIKSDTMNLAKYLLRQGWFKCPNYSFYDSFNLEKIELDKTNYTISYEFLNLGLLKKSLVESNYLTKPLDVGNLQHITPFFDQRLANKLVSQDASFDFSKGGGWETCINDGSFEQTTSARVEMPVIAGSVENTKYKLCCLKQLVSLNPQVHTGQVPNYIPLTFSKLFDFVGGSSSDLVIAINYLFSPADKPINNKNFMVKTKFKTLRIDKKEITSPHYISLNINGIACILQE